VIQARTSTTVVVVAMGMVGMTMTTLVAKVMAKEMAREAVVAEMASSGQLSQSCTDSSRLGLSCKSGTRRLHTSPVHQACGSDGPVQLCSAGPVSSMDVANVTRAVTRTLPSEVRSSSSSSSSSGSSSS